MTHNHMSSLKTDGWRLVKEPSYNPFDRSDNAACWEIPCRRGGRFDGAVWHFNPKKPNRPCIPVPYKRKAHIYTHGKGTLGYSGRGPKLLRELLAVDGVRKQQVGDQEFTVTFPLAAFDAVASVVKPYRRRNAPSIEAP